MQILAAEKAAAEDGCSIGAPGWRVVTSVDGSEYMYLVVRTGSLRSSSQVSKSIGSRDNLILVIKRMAKWGSRRAHDSSAPLSWLNTWEEEESINKSMSRSMRSKDGVKWMKWSGIVRKGKERRKYVGVNERGIGLLCIGTEG